MIKVAIFEDEPLILNSLCNNLPWEELGCEVVCSSHIGIDIYDLIECHIPDIIISDIQMGDINGLDVCDFVQNNYPDTEKIIITRYGTIEYAKIAFKSKVLDFILKPISRPELLDAVRKAIIRIKSNNMIESTISKLNSQVDTYKESVFQKFLIDLIQIEKIEVESIVCALESANISLDRYFCLGIEIAKIANESDLQIIDYEIEYNTLLDDFNIIYSLFYNEKYYCLFHVDQEVSLKENYAKIMENIISLQERFKSVFKIPLYMCYSEIYQYPHFLQQSFKQVHFLFDKKFFANKDHIKIPLSSSSSIEDINISNLINSILFCNSADMRFHLEKFKEYLITLSESDAKYLIVKCFLELKESCIVHGINIEDKFRTSFFVESCLSNDYYMNIYNNLDSVISWCLQQRRYQLENTTTISTEIISYIEQHYKDNLNVSSIALTFNYNSKYLSTIVKKECGKGINELIVDLRINKAKEFLSDNNIKIYDIAEMSGFNDSKYFSQIFKKKTNLAPVEYRKLCKSKKI